MTMKTSEKEPCFNARVVSLYFGIFMIIISGLSALACIIGFVYICIMTSLGFNLTGRSLPEEFSPEFSSSDVSRILFITDLLIFILVISLLEIAFCIVLVHGALKRNTSHLKVYFIYGTVISAIALLWSIVWPNLTGVVAFFCCCINSVLSLLAYMAYRKIKRSTEEFSKFDIPANTEEVKTKI